MNTQHQQFYNSFSVYLLAAQSAAVYGAYTAAAYLLVSALDPLNAFGSALSETERHFFRSFVHSCIDELGRMLTEEINAAEEREKKMHAEYSEPVQIAPKHVSIDKLLN